MLELYRASAGSGKTYTLAKKYIWYFITITPEGGTPRLRTEAELIDSARHILAVTFTNKATNEMQMRIVDALYELSTVAPVCETDRNGNRRIRKPDYMQDFTADLNISPVDLAAYCSKALAVLLENYSDFNVSTIDSFFQQVLRTFAYESEISDSYQVELDSEYLSQVSVDATLEEIDSNSANTDTPFWIRTLMDRVEKGKWNIFNRSLDTGLSTSPYKDFVKSVGKMENEEFKRIRNEVERYFEEGHDLKLLYTDLSVSAESPVRRAYKEMRHKFRALKESLPEELAQAAPRTALGKFAVAIRNALQSGLKWDTNPDSSKFPKLSEEYLDAGPVKKWIAANGEIGNRFSAMVLDTVSAINKWRSALISPEFLHWRLYSVNLPFMALFDIVNRKRREYLDETGAVELGETSMILRGVIGDSDTPFIYERLGTRLNHFLIDEFQDTSGLQWEIMSPLLHESMSRENGNLIIGDAKQSIYRFRNANPSLITTVVPEEFSGRVDQRGLIPSENTNYRSELRVVQFNNSFFENLVEQLDAEVEEKDGERMKFGSLYSNVVQSPNNVAPSGYVELRLTGDSKTVREPGTLQQIPKLVRSLIDRGYLQKEIAILVQTHIEGEKIIGMLTDYNANREDGAPELRFVSEQSLKISSSRGVMIITGVLENMARGAKPEIRTGEETHYKGVCNWSEIMANFKYFAMGREEEPVSQLLEEYLTGEADFNVLSELLSSMQSLAIPALVEAISATFLNDDIRRKENVYLAAFQDIVLEYCESHPTDIGSFLKWWNRKSTSASISSPENSDAVQIVTVHKSKGLQYECVIIPFADWDFGDRVNEKKKEWRWVTPQVLSHPTIPMPKYIPIETSTEMEGTAHAPLLYEYYDMVRMDRLNSAYVAFTRAKKELYVFCAASGADKLVENSRSGASKTGLGTYLLRFIEETKLREYSDSTNPRLPGDTIQDLGMTTDEIGESVVIKIGRPIEQPGKGRKPLAEMTLLESYTGVSIPKFLKYRSEGIIVGKPSEADGEELTEEEDVDLDPRSEGNLKHAVLELVKVASDLPRAVRHLCLTGVMEESMAKEIEASLASKLTEPDTARWFDGSARVITERPVLKGGYVTRRPDRLLIFPDGHAEVVDYKFGKIDKSGKYRRQIGGYVKRLSETGQYKWVRGYIWYVNEGRIISVKY